MKPEDAVREFERLSEEALINLAIADRTERAQKEKMRLKSMRPCELWTDYIITNDKFLSNPSRQNKHRKFPLVSATSCARLLNRIKPLRHNVKRKKASQGAFPGQPSLSNLNN